MYRADLEDKSARKRRRWRRVAIVGVLTLLASLGAAYAAFEIYYFGDMAKIPSKELLWTLRREPSVRLLDLDGREIAARGPRYGEALEAGVMPSHLIHAFLATEDRRFWEHDGVDRRAIARAVWINWREGRVAQGGSTLTQQLVKNLLLDGDRKLKRKLQEIRLSRELEQRLTKPEILTLYLNRIYMGGRSYGVDAASRTYFGKSAKDVTLAEAALLAALPKAPSRFDPSRNPDEAHARADVVLGLMRQEGYISPEQYDEAKTNPAVVISGDDTQSEDAAFGYVFDAAVKTAETLVASPPPDLVIRTTIDVDLQKSAEAILNAEMEKGGAAANASQAALVALDRAGRVRAMVGGRSYKESPFNRATQAKRQPGSSFKTLVFAAALERGKRSDDVYVDERISIGDWAPQNYGGGYRGRVTLREAFQSSINTVAAQIVQDITPEAVVEISRRFGIERDLEPHLSIALGAQEVTLYELTSAYSVIANDGVKRTPFLIDSVANTRGEILYARPEFEAQQIYDPALAREMGALMRAVVVRGTGKSAAVDRIEVAGKTGTSQEWRDAWFVGFSPRFTVGVWVGNDDDTPMEKVTGGGLPATIWSSFVKTAHIATTGGGVEVDENGEAIVETLGLPDLPEERSPREIELAALYGSISSAFQRAAAE